MQNLLAKKGKTILWNIGNCNIDINIVIDVDVDVTT